jgi:hypothetical protein
MNEVMNVCSIDYDSFIKNRYHERNCTYETVFYCFLIIFLQCLTTVVKALDDGM